MDYNIWIPQTGIVNFEELLGMIPKPNYEQPIPEFQGTWKTEWRWRFLAMQGRDVLEISYQTGNNPRIYFTNSGEWRERKIDPVFDKYVIRKMYHYTK